MAAIDVWEGDKRRRSTPAQRHETADDDRGRSVHTAAPIAVMSDSSEPLSTSSATLPSDPVPDHYPKRLHAASDSINGSGGGGHAADMVKEEPGSAAEQPESGEPEPPQKRVKVELDPGSELDIRFLISSKVSDVCCRAPADSQAAGRGWHHRKGWREHKPFAERREY